MWVSLIVPTVRTENPTLFTLTLQSAVRNSSGLLREIVVTGEPPTSPVRVVPRGSTTIRLVKLPDSQDVGCGIARNVGARVARGDVLVFVDSHVYLPPRWDEVLVDALSVDDNGVATLATGILRPVHGGAIIDRRSIGLGFIVTRDMEAGWIVYRGDMPHMVQIPAAVGFLHAVRRDVFDRAGGYLHGYGLEDVELCMRTFVLGYNTVALSSPVAGHYFKNSNDPSRQHLARREKLVWTIHNMLVVAKIYAPHKLREVTSTLAGLYGTGLVRQAMSRALETCRRLRRLLEREGKRPIEELFNLSNRLRRYVPETFNLLSCH